MSKQFLALVAALAAAGFLVTCWPTRSSTQERDPFGTPPPAERSPIKNAETAIRVELAKETDLELSDKSLEMAVKYLAQKHHIEIILDQEATKAAGVDPSAIVSINVHGITLRSALRLMLAPLNLAYIIKDEVLQITTKDKAGGELVTEVYDVRDLVTPEGNGDRDFDSLIDLLTASVESESWADKGGQGTCQPGPLGTLVVLQTQENQREVSNLLAALRSARMQSKAGRFDEPIAVGATMANKKIEMLLADKIDLDPAGESLRDVISKIGKQKSLPIYIDQEALKLAGIDPAAILLTQKFSGISLRSALKLMLQEFNLTTMIRNEVLQVTNKDRAGSELNVRLYPIGDLVDPALATCGEDESPDTLIDCIMSAVWPESWTDKGGQGSIVPFGVDQPILAVSQTDEAHRQVSDLLAQFREVQRKQKAEAAQGPIGQPAKEKLVLKIYQIRDNKTDATVMTPQEVAEAVQGLVQPKSWSQPDIYIRGFTGKLVVRQTTDIQREIDKVLDKIGAKLPKAMPSGFGGGVIPVVGQNGPLPGRLGGGGGGFGSGLGGFGGGGF